MTKRTIALTVDSEIIEQVRQLRINVSGEVNEYLRSIVNTYNEDLEGINIRLEEMNLEKANKKIKHWQNIQKKSAVRIEKWKELQKIKEQEDLQLEKKKIEETKKCINCGRILADEMKKHQFGKGFVCNICFMSEAKTKLKDWG